MMENNRTTAAEDVKTILSGIDKILEMYEMMLSYMFKEEQTVNINKFVQDDFKNPNFENSK